MAGGSGVLSRHAQSTTPFPRPRTPVRPLSLEELPGRRTSRDFGQRAGGRDGETGGQFSKRTRPASHARGIRQARGWGSRTTDGSQAPPPNTPQTPPHSPPTGALAEQTPDRETPPPPSPSLHPHNPLHNPLFEQGPSLIVVTARLSPSCPHAPPPSPPRIRPPPRPFRPPFTPRPPPPRTPRPTGGNPSSPAPTALPPPAKPSACRST